MIVDIVTWRLSAASGVLYLPINWLNVSMNQRHSHCSSVENKHLKGVKGEVCVLTGSSNICSWRSVFWFDALQNVESSWNVVAQCDAGQGKWRGNWRMEWVASTLHTTSEHGVSSITTADAHTSAASSRQNWRPRRFKWTRPFRRKTKSGLCACAITFQTQFTNSDTQLLACRW